MGKKSISYKLPGVKTGYFTYLMLIVEGAILTKF